jgi:hypothetical protein
MVPPKKLCEQQPWHQFCPVISNWARTAVGPVALPEHYLSTMAILSNAMLQYAVCGLAAAHVHFLQGHLKREYDARIDEPFRHRPMLVDCLFYQGKVMEELHKHLIGKDDFADICSVVSTMCLLAMSVRPHTLPLSFLEYKLTCYRYILVSEKRLRPTSME